MKITVSKDEYGKERISHCLKIDTIFIDYKNSGLQRIVGFEMVPYQIGWGTLMDTIQDKNGKKIRRKIGNYRFFETQDQIETYVRDNYLKTPEEFWEVVNYLPKTVGDDWKTYIW